MTKREYDEKVNEIISTINEDSISDVDDKLEFLKGYYPIRLKWYYAKVRNEYRKDGDKGKVFQRLSGKFWTNYEYPGNRLCLGLYRDIAQSGKNFFDINRFHYHLRTFNGDWEYYSNLQNSCEEAIGNSAHESDLNAYRALYSCREYVGYLIHQRARRIRFPDMEPIREFPWVNSLLNMGYLLYELGESGATYFVIIESENNEALVDLLSKDLNLLGKKVIRIKKPIECEGEGLDIKETLSVSVDSKEETGNVISYTSIELVYQNGKFINNIKDLLEYISKEYGNEGQLHVLADGWTTDELSMYKELQHKMVRITPYTAEMDQLNLAYFLYGSYMDYISKVYGKNCKELLECIPEVRFSIIIPARNSSATLRYTLQTCLEQTYNGSYEIIVSDNSTGKNASVYNLCKELNDSRIVYLKTPRDLHLPKSFEYAYLHAKGEYIFAVGSDDGVLPWALEALDKVVTQYPEEEIIQWERGFYAWPGFNGGQQHQFIIPGKYGKDDFGLFYREKLEYLASIFKDSANMYILPMLYINSCFKRSYFQTLLDKTGRLWDGICQDIYMGVVTACINPRILNMRYPLTIAGMSSGSVGANANLGTKTNEEFDKLMKEVAKDNNIGGFCPSYYERFLPQTGTDASSLYGSLLRAISFGILPEEYLEAFDWKRIFLQLAAELDIRDVVYDRKIHQMQYAASLHGEEFLSWFNEAIYEPGLTPRMIDEEKIKANAAKRKYSVGEAENGSLTLDASEYGVQNVYDAVQLFKRLMPL